MFSVTELTTAEGTFSGHVLVFEDITALVRAQRTAAWSEVARRLAHEIKNPLTPIQLSAERLRHKYLPAMDAHQGAALDRMTRTIVQQVDAMKSMVNAFSDYARSPQMRFEAIDLNELIKDVATLYNDDASARLELLLDASLEPVEVDRNRMRQVVHNLLKNALEAVTNPDSPPVEIRTMRLGTEVEVQVRDHGPGIDPAHLDRVFEPYMTSKPKGTGLGLAIVKKIAEEHDGQAWAENAAPSGARLVVKLPTRRTGPTTPENHAA